MACDAHGNPIDFEITGGEVHDARAAPEVIRKVGGGEHFIADKGYDSEEIRQQARDRGMNPVIPRRSNSKKPNPEFDKHLYKMRHLVENLFARLKHYRSIATRFEKLARNYKSLVYLACSIVWIKVGR
jgi:transposase